MSLTSRNCSVTHVMRLDIGPDIDVAPLGEIGSAQRIMMSGTAQPSRRHAVVLPVPARDRGAARRRWFLRRSLLAAILHEYPRRAACLSRDDSVGQLGPTTPG